MYSILGIKTGMMWKITDTANEVAPTNRAILPCSMTFVFPISSAKSYIPRMVYTLTISDATALILSKMFPNVPPVRKETMEAATPTKTKMNAVLK